MSYFTVEVRLTKRGFGVLFIPYLMISTWYYLFYTRMLSHVLENLSATPQTSLVNASFNFSIVFSILVGSFIVDKVDKLRIIYMWATVMPIGTILIVFASNPIYIWMLFVLLGAIFGLSLLAYCAYFCGLTNIKERGRVGGTILFISSLSHPIFLSLSRDSLGVLFTCVFLGVGTFIIRVLKPKEKAGLTTEKALSTVQSYNKRILLLYLIPWLIFCVVNATLAWTVTTYLIHQFAGIQYQVTVLRYLAASFGALAGGVTADWIGRRAAISIGLILYGISTALSGLVNNPGVCTLSAFIGGLSWGIFLLSYTLVVWGDLATRKICAPFYAAGFIVFYFSEGLGYLVLPKILHIPVMYAALVSSLLIFLSNVPVIFAKELLPEYVIKELNLKLYIQWAKKFLKKQKRSERKK